ncbi:BnaA07g00710D [Brassica napus]|uniref:BnaA07g00710D protein n=1 Tax=Brassica napus TaxID=3708 RepID=A0A078HDR4_BRANA|nr:BnaA07g00710D [Brassica napus]
MKTKEMENSNNEGVITTFRHSLDSIPLDLISDILLKFPAKSLVEFTCVSNTWYSIIRSQMFIKTFMSISISRPRILLTFKRNHNGENELLFFSSPDTSQVSNDSSSVVSRHEMTMSRTSLGDYIIHSPSVRGFLCCSHQHQYMVCNPTTRQVINLPEDHRFDHGTMKCYMHLGYDPSMCIHWNVNNVLILRGGALKRFCQIKTPGEKFTCLANYKGKLAGLSLLGNSFNLWVLDDVKEQTWSKTDTFVLSHTLWNIQLKFSGTTDAGELVFAPSSFSDDFHVFYFDIKEKTMRRVKLEGVTNDEEFRCRRKHLCYVSISCDHVENIYLY